jgi:hypothetical protein
MTELLVRPLADAFMQVGVFVALLVAPFGWARYRWGHRLDDALQRYRDFGPVLAALLTMPPGCGGAIIVMALYARGAVTFGAAIAALVATMGDATWVLLAAEPVLTVQLKGLLLVTGALTGYAVDGLGIAPRRKVDVVSTGSTTLERSSTTLERSSTSLERGSTTLERSSTPLERSSTSSVGGGVSTGSTTLVGGGVSTGSTTLVGGSTTLERSSTLVAPAVQLGRPASLLEIGAVSALLWLLLCTAATVSVPTTFQLMDPEAVGRSLLGGVDPYLALGTIGTTFAIFAFARGGCKLADDDTRTAHPTSMAQVLRHGGQEVAFVTVWVAVAYVAWALFTHLSGFDGSQLPLLGVAGVVVGAAVGLIPGCGVQIVLTGIFLAGGMPLSTLVANSISQDGDALLPLLALESRSALVATLITTIPAVVVGTGLVLLS